jgi:hypothetical protein
MFCSLQRFSVAWIQDHVLRNALALVRRARGGERENECSMLLQQLATLEKAGSLYHKVDCEPHLHIHRLHTHPLPPPTLMRSPSFRCTWMTSGAWTVCSFKICQ